MERTLRCQHGRDARECGWCQGVTRRDLAAYLARAEVADLADKVAGIASRLDRLADDGQEEGRRQAARDLLAVAKALRAEP